MNILIRYFNDRKGKRQSHEIRLNNSSSSNPIIEKMEDFECSYGEDLPEALKNHFDSAVALRDSLNEYINNIRTGDFTLVELDGLTPVNSWYIDKDDESRQCSIEEAKTTIKVRTAGIDYFMQAVLDIDDVSKLERIEAYLKALIDLKSSDDY